MLRDHRHGILYMLYYMILYLICCVLYYIFYDISYILPYSGVCVILYCDIILYVSVGCRVVCRVVSCRVVLLTLTLNAN
jgi:hypothetical protein